MPLQCRRLTDPRPSSRTGSARWPVLVSLVAVLGTSALLLAHRAKATPAAPASSAAPLRVKGGTPAMAALLKERAALVNPAKVAFPLNDRRAEIVERNLSVMPPSLDRLNMEFDYAQELLQADRIADSLKAIEALHADMDAFDPAMWQQVGRQRVLMLEATAYLRMAE